VIGIASGLVMVTVPLCLVEIAPRSYTKLYGTLHQISIGLGVITAQSLSLPFGKAFQWRYVFMVAASMGGALLLGGIGMGGKREEGGKDEEDEEMPLVPSGE